MAETAKERIERRDAELLRSVFSDRVAFDAGDALRVLGYDTRDEPARRRAKMVRYLRRLAARGLLVDVSGVRLAMFR